MPVLDICEIFCQREDLKLEPQAELSAINVLYQQAVLPFLHHPSFT
jgi:hypothetical protein